MILTGLLLPIIGHFNFPSITRLAAIKISKASATPTRAKGAHGPTLSNILPPT